MGLVLFVLFTRSVYDYLEDYCYPISYDDGTVLITSTKSVWYIKEQGPKVVEKVQWKVTE